MTDPVHYESAPTPGGSEIKDISHLSTLAICHYVWGALAILFSSIFIVHIVMGVAMLRNPSFFSPPPPVMPAGAVQAASQPVLFQPAPQQQPPAFFGWFFVGFGSCAMLFGWATGICTIMSGRGIAKRRGHLFSLIMAGVNCLSVPIGTTLGVFTFIVLLRPSVKALYDQNRPTAG